MYWKTKRRMEGFAIIFCMCYIWLIWYVNDLTLSAIGRSGSLQSVLVNMQATTKLPIWVTETDIVCLFLLLVCSISKCKSLSVNETAVIRWNYGDPQLGSCTETIEGGNHFRFWVQNGKEAQRWFAWRWMVSMPIAATCLCVIFLAVLYLWRFLTRSQSQVRLPCSKVDCSGIGLTCPPLFFRRPARHHCERVSLAMLFPCPWLTRVIGLSAIISAGNALSLLWTSSQRQRL